MSYDTATPYIASYLVMRKEGKIAFVFRTNTSWMNDHYGLPSGKVEKDESYVAAAIREGKEEVGVTIQPEDLKFLHVMHRHEGHMWVDVYFEVLDWEGEVINGEPEKHSKVEWLDPQNLPDNVIDSVRYALEQISAGEVFSQYGWND